MKMCVFAISQAHTLTPRLEKQTVAALSLQQLDVVCFYGPKDTHTTTYFAAGRGKIYKIYTRR
jgi:hypothetical protein